MPRHRIVIGAPLGCLVALAGCGGGGGGSEVASTPPPPPATLVSTEVSKTTPLPLSPGNKTGTYDVLAVGAPRGSVHIAVNNSAQTYTLTFPANGLPVGSAKFPYAWATTANLGSEVTYLEKYSDGSTRTYTSQETAGEFLGETQIDGNTKIVQYLSLSGIGQGAGETHYLTLGGWNIEEQKKDAAGAWQPSGKTSYSVFVFGDRTKSGDLPLTGSATYRINADTGKFCDFYCGDAGPDKITVDFGARMISAEASQNLTGDYFGSAPVGTPPPKVGVWRIDNQMSGSVSFDSAGAFLIPMTGTASTTITRTDGTAVPNTLQSLTGTIDGAFFGPQAAELGGIYAMEAVLAPDTGPVNQTGAFTAIKD